MKRSDRLKWMALSTNPWTGWKQTDKETNTDLQYTLYDIFTCLDIILYMDNYEFIIHIYVYDMNFALQIERYIHRESNKKLSRNLIHGGEFCNAKNKAIPQERVEFLSGSGTYLQKKARIREKSRNHAFKNRTYLNYMV